MAVEGLVMVDRLGAAADGNLTEYQIWPSIGLTRSRTLR